MQSCRQYTAASCPGNPFRRAYKNVMYITLGLCGCVHGMLTMPMANAANSCWLVFTPHWANKNVIVVHTIEALLSLS